MEHLQLLNMHSLGSVKGFCRLQNGIFQSMASNQHLGYFGICVSMQHFLPHLAWFHLSTPSHMLIARMGYQYVFSSFTFFLDVSVISAYRAFQNV